MLHAFEEIRHCIGIVAGFRQRLNADAVGFGFVGAREIYLHLFGKALHCCDGADTGVARAVGTLMR